MYAACTSDTQFVDKYDPDMCGKERQLQLMVELRVKMTLFCLHSNTSKCKTVVTDITAKMRSPLPYTWHDFACLAGHARPGC